MSDLDEDEDLLALAGEESDNEEESQPSKRQRTGSVSSDDYEPAANASTTSERHSGAAKASPSEDKEDDEESEALYKNPYPLEGKYRDEADRGHLESLPEVERESILFDRSQEMQRFEEARYLMERRRRMKAAETGNRSDEEEEQEERSRSRRTVGVTSRTQNKLQELKKKRQERQKRVRDVSDEEDLESEVSEGYSPQARESDYSQSEDDEGPMWDEAEDSAESQREATIVDVNRIRWGKSLFKQFCHHPTFEDAVRGCFVRVNIGSNRRTGENVYRLCQVRKVVQAPRPYRLMDRWVDQGIVVSHAGSERTIDFNICSDSPVTPSEFEYWSQVLKEAGISLPMKRRIDAKFAEIREMRQRPLTSSEIEEMVARRQRLSGVKGANAVLVRAALQQQREIALESGDGKALQEIDEKMANLSTSSAPRAKLTKPEEPKPSPASASSRPPRSSQTPTRPARRPQRQSLTIKNPLDHLRRISRTSEPGSSAVGNGNTESSVPISLSALDDVIASLDIKLNVDI